MFFSFSLLFLYKSIIPDLLVFEKHMIHILRKYPIRLWPHNEWPRALLEIPEPPKRLRIRGSLPCDVKFLCVVGPRKYTEYGKIVCEKLLQDLAGYPVCIVSGLAHGMDSIAHKAALQYGLPTIAFPGSGLGESIIYPQLHIHLARDILEHGGALISEFDDDYRVHNYMFPQRNRLLAGIADAVLIIEAREKSGTTITARLATDYNRELCAVPGSILNENSSATNRLIKQGATVVTSYTDILEALRITPSQKILPIAAFDVHERAVMNHVRNPISIDELCRITNLPIDVINMTITKLELKNYIHILNGKICQK